MSQKNRVRIDLTEVATRLAAQDRLWKPLVAFDPATRHYERLLAGQEHEAWLLTWLPGQGTEWHDHGGSAGAFTVLQGKLTERTATVNDGRPPQIDPVARELETGAFRVFGRRHLHRVTNDHLEPAVSLHVYAPALLEMNEYAADGTTLRLVTSQLAGANW